MKSKLIAIVIAIALMASPVVLGDAGVAGVIGSGSASDSSSSATGGAGGAGGNAVSGGGTGIGTGVGTGIGGDSSAASDANAQQLGIVEQGSEQSTAVDASEKNNVFAPVFVAPSLNPTKGMAESQLNSIFGGLGFSQTEEYSTCSESIKLTLEALSAGIITKEEAKEEYLAAKTQYKDATSPKRLLSIGPKTRGRHLLNGFGLLANDGCKEFNTDNWFAMKGIFIKE